MLNTEKTHDLADALFFLVMEHVNSKEFIEPDPDSDGTRNTEKGRDLYYAIEDLLSVSGQSKGEIPVQVKSHVKKEG